MITRSDKESMVSELSQKFDTANAAFLVDFKGLNVEQVTDLRKRLYPNKAEMKVVRNTLAKRAIDGKQGANEALSDSFVGNNALVFSFEDASSTAKILIDFAKEREHLKIKAGLMDGKGLDAKGVKALASLPSKEVLRAQLLGLFQQPMSKFLGTLQAVPESFVRALAAKRDKSDGNEN